jgi:hypothetical protein
VEVEVKPKVKEEEEEESPMKKHNIGSLSGAWFCICPKIEFYNLPKACAGTSGHKVRFRSGHLSLVSKELSGNSKGLDTMVGFRVREENNLREKTCKRH